MSEFRPENICSIDRFPIAWYNIVMIKNRYFSLNVIVGRNSRELCVSHAGAHFGVARGNVLVLLTLSTRTRYYSRAGQRFTRWLERVWCRWERAIA